MDIRFVRVAPRDGLFFAARDFTRRNEATAPLFGPAIERCFDTFEALTGADLGSIKSRVASVGELRRTVRQPRAEPPRAPVTIAPYVTAGEPYPVFAFETAHGAVAHLRSILPRLWIARISHVRIPTMGILDLRYAESQDEFVDSVAALRTCHEPHPVVAQIPNYVQPHVAAYLVTDPRLTTHDVQDDRTLGISRATEAYLLRGPHTRPSRRPMTVGRTARHTGSD